MMVSKCLKRNRTELKPIEAERRRGSPSQVDGGCVNRLHHRRHFFWHHHCHHHHFLVGIIIVITVPFLSSSLSALFLSSSSFFFITITVISRYSCCHYQCLNAMIHCNHCNCHNQYIVIKTELPVRRGEGPDFEAFEDRETVPGPGFVFFFQLPLSSS